MLRQQREQRIPAQGLSKALCELGKAESRQVPSAQLAGAPNRVGFSGRFQVGKSLRSYDPDRLASVAGQ